MVLLLFFLLAGALVAAARHPPLYANVLEPVLQSGDETEILFDVLFAHPAGGYALAI
jgi:hypothetical protein